MSCSSSVRPAESISVDTTTVPVVQSPVILPGQSATSPPSQGLKGISGKVCHICEEGGDNSDKAEGTAEDVELAVDAARKALSRNKGKDCPKDTGAFRAKDLRAIAAKVLERKSELARLEALDCGKPLDEEAWDMDDVAGCFEYYADLAEGLDANKKVPTNVPMETFKSHVRKEPIGVVGLITPWNYPLLIAIWKVAPALVAGCAAILKPSDSTSIEVGLPPCVINIVTGLGPEAGALLAAHPHVDKISFIGSTATGSRIMIAASQLVKPVTLELGGKSPIVIFEDTNLDKAAKWTMLLFLDKWSNVQCNISTYCTQKFLQRLVSWVKNVKVSDLEEGCRLVPVISGGQYQHCLTRTISRKDLFSLGLVFRDLFSNHKASVELQGIKGMWSLRASTDDPYITFLVGINLGGEQKKLDILSHDVFVKALVSGGRTSNLVKGRGRRSNFCGSSVAWKDDGSLVLIFSLTGSNDQDGHLSAGRNGVKRLRTVRHPNIISFLQSTEDDIFDGATPKHTTYIVTEPVMALSEMIKELGLEGHAWKALLDAAGVIKD
ncbi:hypothetical protein C5167_048526 [Papaver somniferum]|uniref:Aldehyde dehydrogenase domain-containing protein n=1 Tax=Papaver somniferum TaxID=3469 RepID=A0A4Y7KI74_PAPSO|nr:hypothetical protein C5167_048526 [Papaver somniferum]